jgi:hypothetical protein
MDLSAAQRIDAKPIVQLENAQVDMLDAQAAKLAKLTSGLGELDGAKRVALVREIHGLADDISRRAGAEVLNAEADDQFLVDELMDEVRGNSGFRGLLKRIISRKKEVGSRDSVLTEQSLRVSSLMEKIYFDGEDLDFDDLDELYREAEIVAGLGGYAKGKDGGGKVSGVWQEEALTPLANAIRDIKTSDSFDKDFLVTLKQVVNSFVKFSTNWTLRLNEMLDDEERGL